MNDAVVRKCVSYLRIERSRTALESESVFVDGVEEGIAHYIVHNNQQIDGADLEYSESLLRRRSRPNPRHNDTSFANVSWALLRAETLSSDHLATFADTLFFHIRPFSMSNLTWAQVMAAATYPSFARAHITYAPFARNRT